MVTVVILDSNHRSLLMLSLAEVGGNHQHGQHHASSVEFVRVCIPSSKMGSLVGYATGNRVVAMERPWKDDIDVRRLVRGEIIGRTGLDLPTTTTTTTTNKQAEED